LQTFADNNPNRRWSVIPFAAWYNHCFWRAAVAQTSLANVDLVMTPTFTIAGTDRTATAGIGFAQHIARHPSCGGFHYFVTDTAHPSVPPSVADDCGYRLLTARHGNP
jgi:hypothetical protein